MDTSPNDVDVIVLDLMQVKTSDLKFFSEDERAFIAEMFYEVNDGTFISKSNYLRLKELWKRNQNGY